MSECEPEYDDGDVYHVNIFGTDQFFIIERNFYEKQYVKRTPWRIEKGKITGKLFKTEKPTLLSELVYYLDTHTNLPSGYIIKFRNGNCFDMRSCNLFKERAYSPSKQSKIPAELQKKRGRPRKDATLS